jgi:DNA-binding MarR family transcriptional regulator
MAQAVRPARQPGDVAKGSPSSASAHGKAPALDPSIVAVMTMNANLERLCARQLKALWRTKGISERGLFMLELVQAGLDRPSRLIEYFDVLPSTVTFETDKLVASGLLVRESVPSDRRVVHLSLTAQGRAVHAEVTTALNGFLKPRLDRLPPEELNAFLETFKMIVGPMEAPQTETAARIDDPAPAKAHTKR